MVAAIRQLAAVAARAAQRFLHSMRLQAQLAGLEQDIADLDETIEYAGELSDMAPLMRFERRQMVSKALALREELRALHSEQKRSKT